jgi:multidrug efflux pump
MMSGASPATMASTVAAPLERHLGQIADVTEMSSSSGIGSSRVVLQFGLDRDINGAARDVQAAINASFADLPTTLKSYPVYRKSNPAGAAIVALVMTSKTRNAGEIFDSAASVIAQKVSQLDGVGDAVLDGSSLPGVRVELNPDAMTRYGIGPEDVRAALSAANANAPKGAIEIGDRHYQVYDNDQSVRAEQFRPLIVAYRNGGAVRLDDIAEVVDSAGQCFPPAGGQHRRHRAGGDEHPARAACVDSP